MESDRTFTNLGNGIWQGDTTKMFYYDDEADLFSLPHYTKEEAERQQKLYALGLDGPVKVAKIIAVDGDFYIYVSQEQLDKLMSVMNPFLGQDPRIVLEANAIINLAPRHFHREPDLTMHWASGEDDNDVDE